MQKHFFFILVFILLALPSICQHKEVLQENYSISEKKTPIYQVLLKLTAKTGYNFSYNSDLINDEKPVTLELKNYPLKHIIDTLFQDSSLVYNVIKNHIVIHKRNKTPDTSSSLKKQTAHILIQGTVLSEVKQKPLPYATIGLKNQPLGTIANNDGEFIFKINREFLDDTLIISNIGYENKMIPLEEIRETDQIFFLQEKLYSIQEVIVRTRDPYLILRRAMKQKSGNYYTQRPVFLTSFYRETIKKEERFFSVSEALIKIYQPNKKIFQTPRITVLKSRKTIDYSRKDSIMVKLKAGLEAILYLDIVNEGISFLDVSNQNLYSYTLEDISYFDGKDAYVIRFQPKGETDFPLYTGKVYVEIESLAIIGAEFHLNRNNLRKISESLIIKKKWDIKVRPKSTSYFINYKKSNGKYHLNHIRGDLVFKIRKRGELFGEDFKVSFEMATNNINLKDSDKFGNMKTAPVHKIFIEQISSYDPSFWGDYNYIKPDEPIKQTIEKLNSKIQMLEE